MKYVETIICSEIFVISYVFLRGLYIHATYTDTVSMYHHPTTRVGIKEGIFYVRNLRNDN